MSLRRSVLHVVLALTLLIGPETTSVSGTTKARPPTAKDMVGVWIGFDSDQLTFTRLDLRADATGFCARVSPADTILHDQGVHVYRITRWTVKDWTLDIHIAPASNAFKVGYVKGRIGLASINLIIVGPENDWWREEPFLHPESRISASNEETRQRIAETEKP